MDIAPSAEPNGQAVVLFHGKAFGCYYFRNVIEALTGAGYRVVAPDQIGWGKSSKPDIHYSFQLLAANTAALLDHLGVGMVAVLGHSTGGMTATRFALTYPDRVDHLVLAAYFVHPDPKVWGPLADVLVRVTLSPDYPRWARAAALAFQMIYQQPVRHEYHQIAPPTLLVVGAEDHVVPLGQYAQPAEAARLGDFAALSAAAAQDIPRATRVVIPGCGHVPHLEQPGQFLAELIPFLAS
jgi:pimeloyl-ACP methyl ester carboxylesterase